MKNAVESPRIPLRDAQLWPLSVAAYRALGEAGLIPNNTELRSKLPAYAGAGVKECWLVLGPEKTIEVYGQPKDGQFTEHAIRGPGGTLPSAVLPKFTLPLDALFAK